MKRRKTIMVAGTDFYQDSLKRLLTEINPLWDITVKDAVEGYHLNEYEPIYKYQRRDCVFGIQAEPTNPYDPAALKVFADGTFVGYVPRGNIDKLKRLLIPGISVRVEVYGGPQKYLIHDDKKDRRNTGKTKYYQFVTENDTIKAIIIFEWDWGK